MREGEGGLLVVEVEEEVLEEEEVEVEVGEEAVALEVEEEEVLGVVEEVVVVVAVIMEAEDEGAVGFKVVEGVDPRGLLPVNMGQGASMDRGRKFSRSISDYRYSFTLVYVYLVLRLNKAKHCIYEGLHGCFINGRKCRTEQDSSSLLRYTVVAIQRIHPRRARNKSCIRLQVSDTLTKSVLQQTQQTFCAPHHAQEKEKKHKHTKQTFIFMFVIAQFKSELRVVEIIEFIS